VLPCYRWWREVFQNTYLYTHLTCIRKSWGKVLTGSDLLLGTLLHTRNKWNLSAHHILPEVAQISCWQNLWMISSCLAAFSGWVGLWTIEMLVAKASLHPPLLGSRTVSLLLHKKCGSDACPHFDETAEYFQNMDKYKCEYLHCHHGTIFSAFRSF